MYDSGYVVDLAVCDIQAHRILLPDDAAKRQTVRRSTVFFVHPDLDYVVVPLDGSDKYPPITDRQHLMERLNATYTY